MLWNPYVTQTVSLGYLWLYLIVLPQAVVHQEPLWFLCTLMPSCYNSTLHRHDLHQKSLWKSSGAVFREVRWLDCIFSGCCTTIAKSFCELSVLSWEVLWLNCILPGCCTLLPSRSNLLLYQHDLHQKSFCESSVLSREVLWLDCIL